MDAVWIGGVDSLDSGIAPATREGIARDLAIATKAPNPRTIRMGEVLTRFGVLVVVAHCIRLSLNDIGIPAHQILHRLAEGFRASDLGAKLHLINDQPRLELGRQPIATIRLGFLGFRFDELIIRIEPEKNRVRRLSERAIIEKSSLVMVVAGKELVVHGLLLFLGNPLHPGLFRGLLNGNLQRLGDLPPAIARHTGHGQLPAPQGTPKHQPTGGDFLDHRGTRNLPPISQFTRPLPLQRGEIRHLRHHLDEFPTIPLRWSLEGEHGVRNRLLDRHRDVDGFHLIGENCLALNG